MNNLVVRKLNKQYGENIILKDINFTIKGGEFLSILGKSGCGKTTLLRILIGIESADSGEILLDDIDITKSLPSERKMGIVMQNYALFPNMTVRKNISFALKCHKYAKEDIKKITDEMLELINMQDKADRYPKHLSGGEQQRVAIARTLALRPEIILFDESFSALDVSTKSQMKLMIKDIAKRYNTTMIFITHDQEEAFSMSDRIMVLNQGLIEALDTPYNIYNYSDSKFVKEFIVAELDEKVKSILGSIKNENK